MKKIHAALSFIFLANTLSAFADVDFVCNTSKHTAIVSRLPSGDYRYLSWNKPKDITATPDMALLGGEKTYEGTGPCAHVLYKFANKNIEYVISGLGCTETEPPQGSNGELSVFINGEHKKSWWCSASQDMAYEQDETYSRLGLSKQAVFTFFSNLQSAVNQNNASAVSGLIKYPLSTSIGSKRVTINTQQEFVTYYSRIVTPSVRKAILNQDPNSFFVNYQGVSIGSGEVWFTDAGVFTINN